MSNHNYAENDNKNDREWSEIIVDLLDDIYPLLDLKYAELKDIEETIQKEEDPLKRKRYLITDILGRVFNAIPLRVVGTQVLFRLPFKPDTEGYEWWGPNSLDPSIYVNLSLDEQKEDKYVVPKQLLNMVELKPSHLASTAEDEDPGTSQVINLQGDKFGRLVFEPLDIYPFNTGGNEDLYFFYEDPEQLDFDRLPEELADILAEVLPDPEYVDPQEDLERDQQEQEGEQIGGAEDEKMSVMTEIKSKEVTGKLSAMGEQRVPSTTVKPAATSADSGVSPISAVTSASIKSMTPASTSDSKSTPSVSQQVALTSRTPVILPIVKAPLVQHVKEVKEVKTRPVIILKEKQKKGQQKEKEKEKENEQEKEKEQEKEIEQKEKEQEKKEIEQEKEIEQKEKEQKEKEQEEKEQEKEQEKEREKENEKPITILKSSNMDLLETQNVLNVPNASDVQTTPLSVPNVPNAPDVPTTPLSAPKHPDVSDISNVSDIQAAQSVLQNVREHQEDPGTIKADLVTIQAEVPKSENEKSVKAQSSDNKSNDDKKSKMEGIAEVVSDKAAIAEVVFDKEPIPEEDPTEIAVFLPSKPMEKLEYYREYKDPSAMSLYSQHNEEDQEPKISDELQEKIELREGLADGPNPSKKYIFYPTQIRGYEWLNDNSAYPIRIKDRSFPSVEHYIQFMKFFSGLPKEERTNKKLLQETYDTIIKATAQEARAMTSSNGALRAKMNNFKDQEWNRQKNKIIYYGRIHKILSNPNLRERLMRLKPYNINHKVVTMPSNHSKKNWNTILGGSVYYDVDEDRWYGGVEKDVWELIRDNE